MKNDETEFVDAILRNDFVSFLYRCFLWLNPGATFLDNWHLRAIAYQLDRVRRGEITRCSRRRTAHGRLLRRDRTREGRTPESDPRLLGRSRFLRDASASPALPSGVKSDIAEPWRPLIHLPDILADGAAKQCGTSGYFCRKIAARA